MAQPTNTHDTYDNVGTREDLQDKIYNTSPESTPVLSSIGRLTATNTLHEWQRDSLAAPDADNAAIEGDDVTGEAVTPTQRVGNYTQLFDKVVVVSTDVNTVKKAGRGKEMAYQKAKKMKELKRDIEAMILSKNPAVAGNSTTARKSAGLGTMIFTNVSHGGSGATTAHNSGAATTANTAGTNRTFTEALLKGVMESAATNSSDVPSMLTLTPSHKGAFSAFTGIAANRHQVSKGKQGVIVGGADVYMSDFGEIMVVPNYVQASANANAAYVLNPEGLAVAYRQQFKSDALAKTGHSEKALISAECCLVVKDEKSQAKVDNLTA